MLLILFCVVTVSWSLHCVRSSKVHGKATAKLRMSDTKDHAELFAAMEGVSASDSMEDLIAKIPVFPELVVFDLDQCLWSPEMYTLHELPSKKIYGRLGS